MNDETRKAIGTVWHSLEKGRHDIVSMHDDQWRALLDYIATLEAAVVERDNAIVVLANEVHQYRYFVGIRNAWNDKGNFVLSRLSKGTLSSNSWPQSIRMVNANRIARAAVDASNALEES